MFHQTSQIGKMKMFFRILIIYLLLCTYYSVQANEIAEKEVVAETNSESERVIDCKTVLTLQQELANAKSSLERVEELTQLIPFFKRQRQLNIAKLDKAKTESKTQEEFKEYQQLSRQYQEMIITLEQQQTALEESVTFIEQEFETFSEYLPSCEEEPQAE